jgi:hypothetical protein
LYERSKSRIPQQQAEKQNKKTVRNFLNENKKICDDKKLPAKKDLVQGEDYYINEKGQWVFTALYHSKRGYCCNSGCKHCPYGYHGRKKWMCKETTVI